MNALVEAPIRIYAPTPAGFFITAKLLDEVPSLRSVDLHERIRSMLRSAQDDLFRPLFSLPTPVDFPQTFELLALKYFPIRLQTLLLIVESVGLDKFRTEYFDRAPQFAASLALHAEHWGLGNDEVGSAFRQYFESALKLIR